MRHVVPTVLFAVLGACSSVNTGLLDTDAGTADRPAATDTGSTPDTSTAVDVTGTIDAPPTTDTGSVLAPRDSGPLPVDGGALGDPAWVALDVRAGTACPALTACGGAVLGTWDVSGGCVEVPIPSELMACPGARVTRATGRARGRVTYGPTVAQRASQWEIETEIFVPQLCAAFVGGCTGIQTTVRAAFPDSRCVSEGTGDCRCGVRESGTIHDGDAYTTMSNQIVSDSSGKRWDYCVSGTRMRYNDTEPVAARREPGPIELTRRTP